jgi:hypothetical protein
MMFNKIQFPVDMTDLQVVAVNLRANLRLFASSFSLFGFARKVLI